MYSRWALNKPQEKTFMMFPMTEGSPPVPNPVMVYEPLAAHLLLIPAAQQRDNDKIFREAYEAASGSLSGSGGEDGRPSKRARTDFEDDSSVESCDSDVYGEDFDI